MDFPLDITKTPTWVYGSEELKQNITVLLTNHVGQFIQDYTIGAKFDVHSQDPVLIEEGVMSTLSQIQGVSVKKVLVNFQDIEVLVEYKGEVINFKYNVK